MAQRYTAEIYRERMRRGNCPECGQPPRAHHGWGGGLCTLTDNGVADRLAAFQAEQATTDRSTP